VSSARMMIVITTPPPNRSTMKYQALETCVNYAKICRERVWAGGRRLGTAEGSVAGAKFITTRRAISVPCMAGLTWLPTSDRLT